MSYNNNINVPAIKDVERSSPARRRFLYSRIVPIENLMTVRRMPANAIKAALDVIIPRTNSGAYANVNPIVLITYLYFRIYNNTVAGEKVKKDLTRDYN